MATSAKSLEGFSMKKNALIFLLFLFFAACRPQPTTTPSTPAEQLTPVRLPVGYIPNIQFTPLYVAIDKGFFKDRGLDVSLDYSNEIDSVALVGAGELPFTIASGEQVLLGRGGGLPLVYTMAWYQDYPVGVVSLKDKGIASPADLKGKRVGIPMLSGASYIGFNALLKSAGLTEKDVSLDTIGFTQLESLVTGRDDAVVVYTANEPLQLEAKGYDINLLRTADYNNLVGNGLVTSEDLIKKDPELVRKMVAATLQGLEYTINNPDEAYTISRKYVENLAQDDPVQKKILASSIEMWKTDRPGYSKPQLWENMQQVLMGMGLLEKPLDLARVFTNDYLPGN
jgi:NitT/TauT family transport system substrate-binding protein